MKIRQGYVSNSSSSSFIISCKDEMTKDLILKKFIKLKEFWKEQISDSVDLYDDNYEEVTLDNILNYLVGNGIDKKYVENTILKSCKTDEYSGHIFTKFLICTVSSEYNYQDYNVVKIFNDEVLCYINDEMGQPIEADITFNTRWS